MPAIQAISEMTWNAFIHGYTAARKAERHRQGSLQQRRHLEHRAERHRAHSGEMRAVTCGVQAQALHARSNGALHPKRQILDDQRRQGIAASLFRRGKKDVGRRLATTAPRRNVGG